MQSLGEWKFTRPIQRKGLRVTELLLLMSDKPCRLCDMGKPHKVGFSSRAFIYKGSRGSILINFMEIPKMFIALKDLQKGDYFKKNEKSKQIFKRGDFNRSASKYEVNNVMDIWGSGQLIHGEHIVFIGFEF